jgi:enediyne biosynthesis protein E4
MRFGFRLGSLPLSWLLLSCSSLYSLDWQQGNGFRFARLSVPASGKTGFTLMPPEATGILFTNVLSEASVAKNRILENGSGVALGDVDGDGLCDIYFCRLEGPNVLYRNLGNWKFEDITESAGVACAGQYSTGAVLADVDGDGHLDLLVNSIGGGTRCFLNDGKGHFTELTGTRLVHRFGSTSMALADIDGDGDLDLYVANYRTDTFRDRPPGLEVRAQQVNGQIVVTPAGRFIPLSSRQGGVEVVELGERDFLYLNDGHGRFAPVSWTNGSFLDEEGKPLKAAPQDWGLSVIFRDLNGDGAPDIYVCNDLFYFPDRIWINQRHRGFKAIEPTALRHVSLSSMAVDVADINRDGLDDIFVVDMISRSHAARARQRPDRLKGLVTVPITDPNYRPEVAQNTLFLNRGDGTYTEIAQLSGLDATEWSWGAVFLDVDLDGYEDLLIPTGSFHDVQDADVLRENSRLREGGSFEAILRSWRRFPRLATGKLAFRNRGDLTFEDVSAEWGFNQIGISHGMALADLDNDGDLDLVVNNLHAAAGIYRNDSIAPRLAVRLNGKPPNRFGVGAKIKVLGGPVAQSQQMACGGRYLSSDDFIRVFAAGSSDLSIEVTWPSGKQTIVEHAQANCVYEIDEAAATPAGVKPQPLEQPLFRDVSALLGHEHRDELFNDFERQPLLSCQWSQLGPGVAWLDFDADGWPDLVVSSGKGGHLALFRNNGQGAFSEVTNEIICQPVSQDQTSVLAWPGKKGFQILAGSAAYEAPGPASPSLQFYDPVEKKISSLKLSTNASVGPLAAADVEGNGSLDLFVGGRIVPGRFPEAASSCLLRQVDGKLVPDQANSVLFDKIGLISGAVFSDLDGDGVPELILASQWGSIRVFKNDKGNFHEITHQLGLDRFKGFWNGVATGDFDNDGRLDIVASNWGRNTKYQSHLHPQPLRLYYADFNGRGTLDPIEAFFDSAMNKVVPFADFETFSKALPFVLQRFATYRAFGDASVQELLGERFSMCRTLEVTTLDSMLFLNRGDHFEPVSLPIEAQFAPAFGLAVADFDGDGNEDVFLAQNFFDVDGETTRYDGGRGLLLLGDGKGRLHAVPGQESGIKIYGEQRGCAVADFDGDGRVDLAVAQNRGQTKLYHNEKAAPGLAVRLIGPGQNPSAVGAKIRLLAVSGASPVKEIQAGSGYWSHNSPVQIFGRASQYSEIRIQWPGGKETRVPVPPKAKSIVIAFDGKVSVAE